MLKNVAPDLSHYRILLVDDSQEQLDMLRRLLEVESCSIVTARSRAEALTQFQQKLFHIAIVDVRLEENNPRNRDGLQLVRDIHRLDPGVGIIIISFHADLQDVLELIQSLPAKTGKLGQPRSIASRYLTKTPDDLKKLPDLVQDVFQDVVQINWKLQINDGKSVMKAVTGNLQCTTLTQPPTEQLDVELAELLRKLFNEDTRVDLHPIASQRSGYSKAHVIQVDKYADDVKGATQIVKIGEYPLIEREIHCYHDYIGRLSNVNRHPAALEPYRRTRTLGGMIYTFLNMSGRVVDLAEAYHRVDNQEQIDHLLTNLYTDTLSMQRLYTKHLYQNVDMAAIYTQLLHLDPPVLFERQEELLTMADAVRKGARAKKFYFRDGTGFLNPTEFALTEPLLNDYYETVMHGDLHGRNVLVDKRWDTWLIDFADMGKGPILHDYLTMEGWLLISSIDGVPLGKLFAWSKALFATRDEVYPVLPDTLKLVSPVRKAHQSIMTVRRLAIEDRLGDRATAWRAYLIGLLFTLLRLMKSKYHPPQKRFHALVCAALVAGLLSTSPRRIGLFA